MPQKPPVFTIVDVEITDQKLFDEYVQGHQPSIEAFGGKFLVAAGNHQVIEGDWKPKVLVVHQWPDRETFHAWYNSEDYRPWKAKRQASANANVVLVDGLPE